MSYYNTFLNTKYYCFTTLFITPWYEYRRKSCWKKGFRSSPPTWQRKRKNPRAYKNWKLNTRLWSQIWRVGQWDSWSQTSFDQYIVFSVHCFSQIACEEKRSSVRNLKKTGASLRVTSLRYMIKLLSSRPKLLNFVHSWLGRRKNFRQLWPGQGSVIISLKIESMFEQIFYFYIVNIGAVS